MRIFHRLRRGNTRCSWRCWFLVAVTLVGGDDKPWNGLPFCSSGLGICEQPWTKVYENDHHGDQVSGSLSALRTAIIRGSVVRTSLSRVDGAEDGSFVVVEADNAVVVGDHVCVQTLPVLNYFRCPLPGQEKGECLWEVLACTTSHAHALGVSVGGSRIVISRHFKVSVAWFTKSWTVCNSGGSHCLSDEEEVERSSFSDPLWPVYAHYVTGEPTAGRNISLLLQAVGMGREVRAVMRDRGYAFSLHGVRWSVTDRWVAGHSVLHVGQHRNGFHVTLLEDTPYRWLSSWSTTGKRYNSRWALGGLVSRGSNVDHAALDWVADPCWRHVYTNGPEGQWVRGSLDELLASVRNGHRVRVVVGSLAAEADVVRVRGGHLAAQLLMQLSPLSEDNDDHILLHEDTRWRWRMVHTTGTVTQHDLLVSNLTALSGATFSALVAWYVDARPWERVLQQRAGSSVSGSASDVTSAVISSAKLRLRLAHDARSEVFASASSVHVTGSGSEAVASAQVLRYLGDEEHGESETRFQTMMTWWMLNVDTTGVVAVSAWSVSHEVQLFNLTLTSDTDWFVNF